LTSDPTDVLPQRLAAGVIDVAVLYATFLLADRAVGVDELAWAAVGLLYYGVLEAATGQTLGKRLLAIRVVADDGTTRATPRQVAIRTVLRLVDSIAFYAVVLATGERRQRIGDLAAGTVVVRA
jgi:uncharacterized RDD family membrane protein YckC